MKYLLLLTLVTTTFIGCKEEGEQGQVCMCSDTFSEYQDTASASVYNVFIPNIFTPNDDGAGDIFYVYGQGIGQISITIKEGNNVVFSSNSLASGWDGTISGNSPPSCQTFDYIINVTLGNGITKHFENTVTAVGDDVTLPCPDSLSKCVFGNQYDGTRFNPSLSQVDLSWCN